MYWMQAKKIPHYEAHFQKVGVQFIQALLFRSHIASVFWRTSQTYTCGS